MLFFRSEKRVDEWCRAREMPQRPLVSLTQLWQLADSWYADRMTPDARRPAPDEMRQILARIGLTGPFWNPEAHSFA